jgi:hypothetical protein
VLRPLKLGKPTVGIELPAGIRLGDYISVIVSRFARWPSDSDYRRPAGVIEAGNGRLPAPMRACPKPFCRPFSPGHGSRMVRL